MRISYCEYNVFATKQAKCNVCTSYIHIPHHTPPTHPHPRTLCFPHPTAPSPTHTTHTSLMTCNANCCSCGLNNKSTSNASPLPHAISDCALGEDANTANALHADSIHPVCVMHGVLSVVVVDPHTPLSLSLSTHPPTHPVHIHPLHTPSLHTPLPPLTFTGQPHINQLQQVWHQFSSQYLILVLLTLCQLSKHSSSSTSHLVGAWALTMRGTLT